MLIYLLICLLIYLLTYFIYAFIYAVIYAFIYAFTYLLTSLLTYLLTLSLSRQWGPSGGRGPYSLYPRHVRDAMLPKKRLSILIQCISNGITEIYLK